MPTIHKLPEDVVSKIAAGEVIERPAYAVKELLENAIDAGADQIRIDIEKAGLQKIMISDNGVGMSAEDIEMCFLPHTTSKLQNATELHNVKSMGFRGEALASIAAISDLTIKSRTADTMSGTEITIEDGQLADKRPVGMPIGTTVIVENLFASVPARKKFLRSNAVEFRHILDIVVDQAIALPHIRFFLTHNKKTLLDLPKHKTIHERIFAIFGETMAEHLIPLNSENDYLTIYGFISNPKMSSTAVKHYFFVNNRRISDAKISKTLKATYGTLLTPQSYPIAFLFFQISYEMVDVNVHPRKEQIHFHNEGQLLEALQKAIAETLQTEKVTYYDRRWQKNSANNEQFLVRDGGTQTYAGEILRNDVETFLVKDESPKILYENVAQFHDLYLITETEKGIVIIDQHAAHERVLYEEFIEVFKKRKQIRDQYMLEKIVLLDLPPSEALTLQENLDHFESLGFSIDEFTNTTFKVSAVPTLFRDQPIAELIREMIDDLIQNRHIKDIDTRSHRMLTYLACRSAVKAGDKLTAEEIKELLHKLSQCKNPLTCPHGRPIQKEFTKKELEKMFKR